MISRPLTRREVKRRPAGEDSLRAWEQLMGTLKSGKQMIVTASHYGEMRMLFRWHLGADLPNGTAVVTKLGLPL